MIGEGLDRYDAVSAVGSVVMGIVFDVVREKGKGGAGDINAKYADELAASTVESWRAQR